MGYSYDEAVVREKAKLYLDSISREPVSETANFDPSLPERFTFTEGHMGFQPEEQPFIENIVAAIQTGALSGVQAVGSSVSGDVPVEKDVREHTKLVAKYTTKVKRTLHARIILYWQQNESTERSCSPGNLLLQRYDWAAY